MIRAPHTTVIGNNNLLWFQAMRKERERQIAEGKLKGDAKYVTPRVDSF